MNTQQPDELSRVRNIIWEIEEKSASGDYIFRGEPECYPKVSSALYRQYEEILIDGSNVEDFQNEMLIAAQEHLPGTTSDFEIPVRRLDATIEISSEPDDYFETLPDDYFETLTELQHYGGKTNLIDFTTDSRVALFFACDGSPGKKGRVILRKKGDREDLVEKPREPSNPLNRVIAQKSIFVRPRRGFVEFDRDKDVVEIPADLKKPMLEYLHKYHNISAKTIYNDLHGFIRTQDIHHRAYKELYRGISCIERGEQDKAIQHFNKAIELKPDFFGAYNNRGIAYGKKGDFDSAIKDLNKAIELNPNLAEAYTNRGLAYDRKDEIDTAIRNYSKAIELSPNNAEAYNNRGTAYEKKGEVDTAIYNYSKAIELKPNRVEVYNNRGKAYGGKGEFDNAIADFTTAIELKPDYAEAYQYRGAAYGEKKDWDLAIQDTSKAIELNPNLADAYCIRGIIYFVNGEVDRTIEDCTTAIELNPNYTAAYQYRGFAWLHLGEWDKAKADFIAARNLGVDIVAFFHGMYEEVEDFESDYDVQVPPDLAEMLTRE